MTIEAIIDRLCGGDASVMLDAAQRLGDLKTEVAELRSSLKLAQETDAITNQQFEAIKKLTDASLYGVEAKAAFNTLGELYNDKRITAEEFATLTAGLSGGPPVGDKDREYTVFLVDGYFGDKDAPLLSFDEVDHVDLGQLFRLAMRQDYDMVIRNEGGEGHDG